MEQTVTFQAPEPTEVQIEFVDLDKPTEVTNERGEKVLAVTVAQLIHMKGEAREVLGQAAFPNKLSDEEKRAFASRYAKSFAAPVPPAIAAARQQKKAKLLSMEEYRKKHRKVERQARKKARRSR